MQYKHALFLYPYIESSATATMGIFPPTGIEYVATSAKGLVDKLTLLDLRHETDLCDINKLIEFMQREAVDILCVSLTWNRQYEEIRDLLNLMPDDIPLVVGGYKATERVEELFEYCPKIDMIVRGEGEDMIKEILKGEPLENIKGLSYRKDGKVTHNPNRPLPDVNSIAYPDRSLRRGECRLSLHGVNVTNVTYDTVLSSRGCPFNCKFCTFSLNPLGQKRNYAARTVDSVIREIEEIKAEIILFSDDNFFTDIRRAEKICDLIIERGIKKRFIAQARIDIAKYPKLLDKIAKAGFKVLLLGIESPHNWVLEQFNKGFDQATIRKCFETFKKFPIYYHGYFIYGNIGETEEEMLYIAQFAKEIGVDSITFHKLRMERFSPLKEIADRTPGYHVTSRGEVYSDKFSHPALKKIGRKIKFSFYTPITLLKMLRKLTIVRFFTFKELVTVVVVFPLLFKKIIQREIHKNRLGDSLKRIFVNNK
ncbi:MAG: radical SAM protein [Candidatus Omnitrophica bacterium]|nr:radical SAM protein [Candidatus Omnitrophota bacterium]